MDVWRASSKNVDSTVFDKNIVFRFPYPGFHHSTIPSFHVADPKNSHKKHYNPNKL